MYFLLCASWLTATLLVGIGLKFQLANIRKQQKDYPTASLSLIACILKQMFDFFFFFPVKFNYYLWMVISLNFGLLVTQT